MSDNNYCIAVLPGDGIGPEVMLQTLKVLNAICKRFLIKVNINNYDVGGSAIDHFGVPLPNSTLRGCEESDAILFGSVGGPKWNYLNINKQPERGSLLPLRKHFKLFSNLRPAKLYPGLESCSPLKKNIVEKGFDILCVRELIGGIYFGKKGKKNKGKLSYAFDTESYYSFEIERIAHCAFNAALKRNKKVTSIDKANVLETSVMWRKIINEVSKKYPGIVLDHMYIDNATMQIIKNPSYFDTILCSNLFGDILSDECGAITGSIGMLPSASLNEYGFGLYEPAGGSAPEIAGKNIANPIAQILSLSMLFRYSLNSFKAADAIEEAVIHTLKKGLFTKDLIDYKKSKKYISTDEMGSEIVQYIINGEKHE